ncbi:hypothetical protein KAX97_15195 [candidate division WOR-3 bacterium]|nr:hypothetical protein [candidate division WOR-3 bacterium]
MKPKNLNDISTEIQKYYNLKFDESLWHRILKASQKIGMKPSSFMRSAIVEKLERQTIIERLEKIGEQMKEGK